MSSPLKIYFAGSIRAGRADCSVYQALIAELKTIGQVLTEHVGTVGLEGESGLSETEIFSRDVEWLTSADLVVAEVTTPSLGVGYELALAAQFGKPVLCLYRLPADRRLSAMLLGNPKINCVRYQSIEEGRGLIQSFVRQLKSSYLDGSGKNSA